MFGQELVQAFEELKAIFDPGNRMNPGKDYPERDCAARPAPPSAGVKLLTLAAVAGVPALAAAAAIRRWRR